MMSSLGSLYRRNSTLHPSPENTPSPGSASSGSISNETVPEYRNRVVLMDSVSSTKPCPRAILWPLSYQCFPKCSHPAKSPSSPLAMASATFLGFMTNRLRILS